MAFFPVFLSVVLVLRDHAEQAEVTLSRAVETLTPLVSDFELVVIDNASSDATLSVLRSLTGADGIPNVQVFALTRPLDVDSAAWVGLENALGDFVAVIDPLSDDIGYLPAMLEKAAGGADVVFARNEQEPAQSLAYRAASAAFNATYKWLNGIDLEKDAARFRLLSRRVVNFILQHPQPALTYRHLPATGGFSRANLTYSTAPRGSRAKRLGESIDRGMRLLVSTTRLPMRLVTSLSLFGAVANVLYSGYVVAIGVLKADVAPGWISLSLQQSGMFVLISLVLLVLGEYILHMASLSNEGPLYHVGQEFNSVRMTRREKLNIEETQARVPEPAGPSAQREP